MLKLIAFIDEKNGIVKNNTIPLQIKKELLHFRNNTKNNIVVMETKTYYSFNQDLENVEIIVLSRNNNLVLENVRVINDYNEILELSKIRDVFVIGGSEIYKIFESYYDELVIYEIKCDYNCDRFLNINLKFYELTNTETFDNHSVKYYKSLKDKILYGNICAEHLKKELININNELIDKYKKIPTLSIIQIGNDYSSNIYIKNKIKLAKLLNINCLLTKLDESITQEQLIKIIKKNNKNKSINGILVQSPLPSHISDEIYDYIDVNKDVDCLNKSNIGLLWKNKNISDILVPCTALGVIKLLEYYNINLESKNVVIIGRSQIVSKPLIALLLNKNATVNICHSKTHNLKELTKKADIVISAIGESNFFDSSYFNENSIIVDVGINRDKDNRITGDVDFLDVIKKINKISPVPYGIGPMTLISLFNNLLICYKNQRNKR